MRHAMASRRRNRQGGGGGGGGGHHRPQQNKATVFDSNGPDVRIRGTAYQIVEKYQTLAKDAMSSGDRVLAENYLQHAEHYQRLIGTWADEAPRYQNNADVAGPVESPESQSEVVMTRPVRTPVSDDDLALPASIFGGGAPRSGADEPARPEPRTVAAG